MAVKHATRGSSMMAADEFNKIERDHNWQQSKRQKTNNGGFVRGGGRGRGRNYQLYGSGGHHYQPQPSYQPSYQPQFPAPVPMPRMIGASQVRCYGCQEIGHFRR